MKSRLVRCLVILIFSTAYITSSVHCLSTTTPKKVRPRIPILEYHDAWVCVDKPSGITVHRGNGTPKHTSVLTSRVKKQLARKVFPVHRLDHRTSGAMLFAFDSETAGILHEAAIRKGQKQYIALVRGVWSPSGDFCKSLSEYEPIEKSDAESAESESSPSTTPSVVYVDKPLEVKGITKEAVTKFTLLGTTAGNDEANERCSLVLCEPLTGRTHQIRRHAFAMGHPIIGDSQHGDNAFNRWWRKHKSFNRLGLHCWKLEFDYQGDHHECLAPLPTKFRAVLEDQLPLLWEASVDKEPQLGLDPVDKVDGTHGRSYKKRKSEDAEV